MTDTPNKPGDAIRRAYAKAEGVRLVGEDGKCYLRKSGRRSPPGFEEWLAIFLAEAERLGVDTTGDDWAEQIEAVAKQLSPEKEAELFYTPPKCAVIDV